MALALTVEIAGLLALAHVVSLQSATLVNHQVGVDFRTYMDATKQWLNGGPFYQPWQLTGPYDVLTSPGQGLESLPILYPPYALFLFVPFAVISGPVAAILWWVLPLGALAWVVLRLRPRPSTWPVLALLALNLWTFWLAASGNPVMWAAAGIGLGTLFGWPAALAVIKPTVAPLALIGVHTRSWWLVLALILMASLSVAPLWPDYVSSTLNAHPTDAVYLLANIPIVAIPLVAWLGRTRGIGR